MAFSRAPDGRLVVSFHEGHRALLDMLLAEVGVLLSDDNPDRRVMERLFPRAYLDPTEDVAETEWQDLVHRELVDGKVGAFEDVRAVLARATPDANGAVELTLDATEEDHLLGALNDLRLALAELTGVTDPEAASAGPPGTLDTVMVLGWLAELVSDLVDLKLSDLPD